MKAIDNFNRIADIIRGKAEVGEFYFLQILRRRKDNPEQDKDMIVIANLYIEGEQDLLKKRDNIIAICNLNNARAYFRLNKRSKKTIALQTLKLITASIVTHQYNIHNAYDSICGRFHSDDEKKWVLDVDIDGSLEATKEVNKMIAVIEQCRPIDEKKIISIMRTPNGYHLITKPFNVKTFRELYTEKVDIHKDNPCVLYMPIQK